MSFGLDLHDLLHSLGSSVAYVAIFGMVFAESGLLIGFFLPGDSLLFAAGILAAQGFLNIWILTLGCFVAAVVGDSVGYAFGHRYGRQLFNRPDSTLFRASYLTQAEDFYTRHGKKTIVIARFVPIVRTFAPIVAGIGKMEYRTFLMYNVIGALLWAVGITLLGYVLGQAVPNIERYLIPGILLILAIMIIQPFYHVFKDPVSRAALLKRLHRPTD